MRKYIVENGILVQYKGNSVKPLIPKYVTEIGAWSFTDDDIITSINIPSSVRIISNWAFRNCYNLTSINIPNSVTEIGYGAFTGCKNITKIEIPDSVRRIDEDAFDACYNLASIKIPNSVTHIGKYAFNAIKEVKPQIKSNGALRAFKAFNEDWTCRRFQYEIGKSYHQEGEIICCSNGFHACPNPLDVFGYYYGDLNKLRFAEVELSGKLDIDFDKIAGSDIKIIREVTVQELFEIYNSMEKW